MEVALKAISGRFDPIQLNIYRYIVGGLFLIPFALRSMKQRGARLTAHDVGFLALSGFVLIIASMTLYQIAIQYTPASVVAILFSCNPVFVIPLSIIFFGERLRTVTIVSLVLSLSGMIFIINPLETNPDLAGILLTLGSTFLFAVYGLMNKRRAARYGSVAVTAFSFLLGSLELAALVLATRIPGVAEAMRSHGMARFASIPLVGGFDIGVLPLFLYICVAVTAIGNALYFMAVETMPAATTSLVFYLKPALAPILAAIILGESIASTTIAGTVLILSGSFVTLAFRDNGFLRRKAGR